MAISDRFGDAAEQAKEKLADKDERDRRIDQAGDVIDAKTNGKVAEKVDRAQNAARQGGDRAQNAARKGGERAQNRNNNNSNNSGNNSNRNNNR
ncbi:Rv0909 family putative TA system antitoxin [Asanoa sp. NPDC049573]|uniref:Rv0909 family putative TA system antitoxin n=1 Tax=Asanoa sp. NPDC049573 TaxID=3155396 RepID=UPI003427980F